MNRISSPWWYCLASILIMVCVVTITQARQPGTPELVVQDNTAGAEQVPAIKGYPEDADWSKVQLARDLYRVTLSSSVEAERLAALGVEPIVRIGNEYLVLADSRAARLISLSELQFELLARSVEKADLGLVNTRDQVDMSGYRVIYEQNTLQLLLAEPSDIGLPVKPTGLLPIRNKHLKITYSEPTPPSYVQNVLSHAVISDLDSLIDLVKQDSLESYLLQLEAFDGRLSGTSSNYAARDWIMSEFQSFGYDSVLLDAFTGEQLPDNTPVPCYNVIAYKVGNLYPDQQIVVGAHFDAVPGSPGADDNGSGTSALLEIARVLSSIETAVTFVFVALDSEEPLLLGSYHYVDEAVARGDDIVFMLNLDMIGHMDNDQYAELYYGPNDLYGRLWKFLAAPAVGITGFLGGSFGGGSDHWPFEQAGFDVLFVHEFSFSTHYHDPSDSTTYLSLDYMTRIAQASLATVYAVSNSDDFDGDGVQNETDNCLLLANSEQTDGDNDGFGDVCDGCPSEYNPDQLDGDADGSGDICDNCPEIQNPAQEDRDGDGFGDICDNCPSLSNPDQIDTDGNGVGDLCEEADPYYTFFGESANDYLGGAVSGAGDINNDGFEDVIVGAVGHDEGGALAGCAYVFSGSDGSVLHKLIGEVAGDSFGSAVCGVGDIDQDGYDDFMVGAPGEYGAEVPGKAYLFSGQTGSVIYSFYGEEPFARMGFRVSGAGDVNNDGVPDAIIAAVGSHQPAILLPGKMYIISGTDGAILSTLTSPTGGYLFGLNVCGVGDIDLDGFDDYMASKVGGFEQSGSSYLFSGQDGTLLHTFGLGSTISGAGDVNSDGWPDVMVAFPLRKFLGCIGNPDDAYGAAYVYSGQDFSLLYEYYGEGSKDRLGTSLSGLGDVNLDGYDDFAVGSAGASKIIIYSGLNGSILTVYHGPDLPYSGVGGGDWFGGRLSGTADVNGDNVRDIILGCSSIKVTGPYAGAAFVYLLNDLDGDNISLAGDNCPDLFNPDQTDGDGDEVGNDCDNCPEVANYDQSDLDEDNIGDLCDECTDTDGDGYGDQDFPSSVCGTDNCPGVYNPNQADGNGDGIGDMCCCIGLTGNIDDDPEEICDLGDLTKLIDFLFISFTEPDCIIEANVDGDPEGNVDLGDLTKLIDYLFISFADPAECL